MSDYPNPNDVFPNPPPNPYPPQQPPPQPTFQQVQVKGRSGPMTVLWVALGIILAMAILGAGCVALLASSIDEATTDFATTTIITTATTTVEVEGVAGAPAITEAPSATEATESQFTRSQENAVKSAESYLSFTAFSRQGLIDQLSSEFGEGFSVEDATFAVDYLNVDWNAQAAKSAEEYLAFQSFSRQGLIDQLSSEFGEQFTLEQATYGVDQTGL